MNDEEQAKHRSTKDRKTWCKGREGAPHQATLLAPARLYPSYPAPTKDITILVEQCTQCGKYLSYFCKPYTISPGYDKPWKEWDKAWTRYREQERDASRR